MMARRMLSAKLPPRHIHRLGSVLQSLEERERESPMHTFCAAMPENSNRNSPASRRYT